MDPKDIAAGLDPENAPQLAQDSETTTATRKARAAIEDARGVEKSGHLVLGLGLVISPGDVPVPFRLVGGRQAQRDEDEDERRGSVRRRTRKNGRRKR